MRQQPALVVLSHLRWDFVYQRPQHLLSRLATKRRVLFIEEPIPNGASEPTWERATPAENVVVCRLRTPLSSHGFSNEQLPTLTRLVKDLLREENVEDPALWFYTPMALPVAHALTPRAVIYDCMDELSAFLGAPPELLQREAELLEMADLVFTGGPSLYRAKKDRHPNVYCFPSSVDARHFGQARDGIEQPDDQRDMLHPRLGFFGVIDERMDLPLLDALAGAHPDWQIVMVGPVVKIDPATLPRRPNIHYLGQRSYADLPRYLGGWDVCLLPFARNEATRFISPTKTLEYMAAERMIVSTPITDVAEPYGNIVFLGDTPERFIKACEKALGLESSERNRRIRKMRQVLARTSWDRTAEAMDDLIADAVARRRKEPTPRFSARALERKSVSQPSAGPSVAPTAAETPPVIVVGAGPTGLSAAYHLGKDALLLEQNDTVGGWCRSVQVNGFTFDYAGHIMFSNDPYVHEMYEMLLGDNVHWQNREAWIYSKNVYTRYPFQGALYGLPPQVIKECIVGAIEARFGSLKEAKKPSSNGSANGNGLKLHANGNGKSNGHACKELTDCCADGILESTARLAQANGKSEPANFEEFIYKVWGAGIAKHFAIPYNKKLWAVPLTEMETSWLGGRVPLPDLEEMIEGALQPVPKPMGPNARFGYPLFGGFQSLMNGFLPKLKGPLWYNSRVAGISPRERLLRLDNGRELHYEQLISTMPLPLLIRLMGADVPPEVRQAAAGLRFVSVRCVHLGVGRENLTEKHWIYYPEDTVFHRIFVQGNASPHCNPPGGFGLTCEITYSEHKPLPCDGEALIRRCIEDCHKVGIFSPDDPILATEQCDLRHAYVVYDHARKHNVALIREWLKTQHILLAGRYSEWEYYNSDHAFLAGKRAADEIRQLRREQTLIA